MYSYGYLQHDEVQGKFSCVHVSLSPAEVRQLKLLYLTNWPKSSSFMALQAEFEA